jgi:hypothetical protein
MVQFDLEITHACNKHCPFCDQRIASSPFKHMSWEQYARVVDAMRGLKVGLVRLIGGEPLMHPEFSGLVRRVRNDFPGAAMVMTTNGALLDLLRAEERRIFARITVSYYGAFNAAIVRRMLLSPKEYANVYFTDSRWMYDPDLDPNLDEKTARRCLKGCSQTCVRVIGERIYGCCIAEGIERHYKTEKVHCELRPGWPSEFAALPTYKACQRCYYAGQLASNWRTAIASRTLSALANNRLGNVARKMNRFLTRGRWLKIVEADLQQARADSVAPCRDG